MSRPSLTPSDNKLATHDDKADTYGLSIIGPNEQYAKYSPSGLISSQLLKWLNLQIPRKVDETKRSVTNWQPTTFQIDYDHSRNPWMV